MTGTIRHGTKETGRCAEVDRRADGRVPGGSGRDRDRGRDGIGYEAARALMGLEAAVTIAEFDEDSGTSAARRLQAEEPASQVLALIGCQAEVGQLQAELVAGGSGP